MVASNSVTQASLADVLPSCLAAVGAQGFHDVCGIGSADQVVLFLVDGLGVHNIEFGRGYARFLASRETVTPLTTVFPSTTAAALATLSTGTQPGEHGILGYRVWNPSRGELVNQLNGIDDREVTGNWLARPSLVRSTDDPVTSVTVIGHQRYRSSAMTHMLYTDAAYRGFTSLESAFEVLTERVASGVPGVTLVYLSQLDELAHRHGVDSYQWLTMLEELDAALAGFARTVGSQVRLVLTADHGVIDVAASAHRDFGLGAEMLDVRAVGGEPRCLQVYLEPTADVDAAQAAWISLAGDHALVVSPAEIASSRWGVQPETTLEGRLPDFYVFAPEGHAWYDGREPTSAARGMIGQHGGLSETELKIPLLRLN